MAIHILVIFQIEQEEKINENETYLTEPIEEKEEIQPKISFYKKYFIFGAIGGVLLIILLILKRNKVVIDSIN